MEALFIPLALLAGGLLALQAGANTQLAKATGNPFAATTIQVVIAGGLLLARRRRHRIDPRLRQPPRRAVVACNRRHRHGDLRRVDHPALPAPGRGRDSRPLHHRPDARIAHPRHGRRARRARQPPGAAAIAGTLAVLAGAVAIVRGQAGSGHSLSVSTLGWSLLALLAGAVLPVQGAVNGLLRGDIGAPFVVGVVSFGVATLAMLPVLLVTLTLTDAPRPRLAGLAEMPWWGWLGALCGATYVTTIFTTSPRSRSIQSISGWGHAHLEGGDDCPPGALGSPRRTR